MTAVKCAHIVTIGLLLGLPAATSMPAGASTVAAGAVTAAHPVPAAAGQFGGRASLPGFAIPPTTADCVRVLHLACYQPAQLRRAYDLGPLHNRGQDGRGTTIAVIDPFGSPTIARDLKIFDRAFHLPDPPSFQVIQPAGSVPAFDPADPDAVSWAQETTLDVEAAHLVAPGARIILAATPITETQGVQGFPEIIRAENHIIDHHLADVISQSFDSTEEVFPSAQSIQGLRSAFVNAQRRHVTVLAATGDNGATNIRGDLNCCYRQRVTAWPATDPLVTAVGGTHLTLDGNGTRIKPDTVWNDSHGSGGGGRSQVFARPGFQDAVAGVVDARRGIPDISMSGAVDGAAVVYWGFSASFAGGGGTQPGFHIYGGTSEATPLFAGIVALADQAAGHPLGDINPALYRIGAHHPDKVTDVTRGNNSYTFCISACDTPQEKDTTVKGYQATGGYDLASGLGTVDAAAFVPALVAAGG